jgi:hypothetical protein
VVPHRRHIGIPVAGQDVVPPKFRALAWRRFVTGDEPEYHAFLWTVRGHDRWRSVRMLESDDYAAV